MNISQIKYLIKTNGNNTSSNDNYLYTELYEDISNELNDINIHNIVISSSYEDYYYEEKNGINIKIKIPESQVNKKLKKHFRIYRKKPIYKHYIFNKEFNEIKSLSKYNNSDFFVDFFEIEQDKLDKLDKLNVIELKLFLNGNDSKTQYDDYEDRIYEIMSIEDDQDEITKSEDDDLEA